MLPSHLCAVRSVTDPKTDSKDSESPWSMEILPVSIWSAKVTIQDHTWVIPHKTRPPKFFSYCRKKKMAYFLSWILCKSLNHILQFPGRKRMGHLQA